MKGDGLHPHASFFVQLQRMFHLGFILVKDASLIGSITHMIDIAETLKLTQGQGHKVKDQGQISNNVKTLVKLIKKSTDG